MIFRLKNNCNAPGSLITCLVNEKCSVCFNKTCIKNNTTEEVRECRDYIYFLFKIKYNEIGELDTDKYNFIQISYNDDIYPNIPLFSENTIKMVVYNKTPYYEFNGLNKNN